MIFSRVQPRTSEVDIFLNGTVPFLFEGIAVSAEKAVSKYKLSNKLPSPRAFIETADCGMFVCDLMSVA
jgi:hypothetical protein